MRHLTRRTEEIKARVVEKEIDPAAREAALQKMRQAREEIVRSGVPLLDWDDLEREIAERRGDVTSAMIADVDELVTTEKPTRPIHRISGLSILSIHP